MYIKGKGPGKLLAVALVIAVLAGTAAGTEVKAASIPVYHDIPAYQQKDVFSEERVKVQGIKVEEVVNDTVSPVVTKAIEQPVKFVIYNSTKQEIEQTITSQNGVLPELNLVNDHNYIIYAEDSDYEMNNVYLWIRNGIPVDIKNYQTEYDYPEVESLQLYCRETEEPDPDHRVMINLPVYYYEGLMQNIRFKLVSDVETIETTNKKGYLREELLEDVVYMVTVENDIYDMEPLPITVKDKSEYGAGKYTYNHSNCARVESIQLVDKKDAHQNDTTITSLSGNTVATGMDFKDYLLLDKELDPDIVSGLESTDYDVIDLKIVNPHRWEVSKLAAGEYKITEKTDMNKQVKHVYYLDSENQLQKLEFSQASNRVTFIMNSMSLYPIVIEYEVSEEEPDPAAGEWHHDSRGWWYRNADGTYPKSCWRKIDEKWYYFNSNGYCVTGWQKIKNVWYYFDSEGVMHADEWIEGTYYLKSNGAMATGWLNLSEEGEEHWYYLNSSGKKLTGWQKSGNKWYYLDAETGIMHAEEWIDATYYVQADGAMATGWLKLSGEWYYLRTSGARVYGWQKINNIWYYFSDTTGIMLHDEWLLDTYYLKGSGAMATGWLSIDGTYYYFASDGKKVTSRWVGNYYLKADGTMAVSERVDNDKYYVDETGKWVPGK